MTKDIANIFKESLTPLKDSGLISNLEGLVRVLEYKPTASDKSTKIAFPVDCQEPEDCQECESLFVCVPEKNKKCLIYFEGTQSREIATLEGATKYEATISLICWYNLGFFQKDDFLQTRLISLFSNLIKRTSSTSTELNPINFNKPEVISVYDSDASIFSKYSYNEGKSNFLGCKYSTFKIDFKVKFFIYEDKNCISDIVDISNIDCS
jgi:hypothetical protein